MPDEAKNSDAPLLALETSGARLSVALWGPAGLLDEAPLDPGARHGSALAIYRNSAARRSISSLVFSSLTEIR